MLHVILWSAWVGGAAAKRGGPGGCLIKRARVAVIMSYSKLCALTQFKSSTKPLRTNFTSMIKPSPNARINRHRLETITWKDNYRMWTMRNQTFRWTLYGGDGAMLRRPLQSSTFISFRWTFHGGRRSYVSKATKTLSAEYNHRMSLSLATLNKNLVSTFKVWDFL